MQGYTISYKNPITGSIETDWKEISRNIKVERKLKTHNENYSTYKERSSLLDSKESQMDILIFLLLKKHWKLTMCLIIKKFSGKR